MATAILYGAPGSGKTINATRLPGKSLLLSSDNSALVLKNFDRPNLTIKEVALSKAAALSSSSIFALTTKHNSYFVMSFTSFWSLALV